MSNETPDQEIRLWQVDHPYYCYGYVSEDFDAWPEMKEAATDLDTDYNLLFRWDWSTDDGEHTLTLAYVQQRKGQTMTFSCPVTAEDEPDIRLWLTGASAALRALWAPLDLA